MPVPVLIYSPDEIRGRIILKILGVKGIKPLLFSSHFEIEEAIHDYREPIIIFDAKKRFSQEVSFLRSLLKEPQKKSFILLSHPQDVPSLESLGVSEGFFFCSRPP